MTPNTQQSLVLLITMATAALAVFAAAAAFAYSQRLRHQRLLGHRDLVHRERMAAIEKGLDLPAMTGSESEGSAAPEHVALASGLVLLLGGVGFFAAFIMIPTPDGSADGLHHFASLGLIPAFAGTGLLLFSWMARASSR
jgi:hypothetical protein